MSRRTVTLTLTLPIPSLPPLASPFRLAALGLAPVWHTLLIWQTRAHDRAMLAEMDERMRRDIGATPEDIRREAAKPFWRP